MEATLPRHLADASVKTQGKTPPLQVQATTSTTGGLKAFASGKRGRDGLPPRRRTALRSMISGRSGGGARQDGDDENQNDHDARDGGTVDQQQHQGLACPFYKLDTLRHKNCSRLWLSRIRDVKQHLIRRHCQPPYCPVCGDVFEDTWSRDIHIMVRNCHSPLGGVPVNIEGVTGAQRESLGRRVDRTLDEAAQWFSVWDILFPNVPRPLSPYLPPQFGGEVLDIVQDYWERHKDALVAEVAQSAGTGSDETRRLVTELSSRAIANLFSSFRTTSQSIIDPASPSLATRSIPTPRSFAGLAPLAPTPRHGEPANINDGEQSSSNSTILNPYFPTSSLDPPRPISLPIHASTALPPNPYSHPREFYTPRPIPGTQSVEPLGTSLGARDDSELAKDYYLGEYLDHGDFPHDRTAVTDSSSAMEFWADIHQVTAVAGVLQEWSHKDLHL